MLYTCLLPLFTIIYTSKKYIYRMSHTYYYVTFNII
nr:MAG TPA: hypothetical protein [Caudoviricetes sp.]